MAEEKKSIDISTYYAKQEITKFAEIWEESSQKIQEMFTLDEPDADTLAAIIRTVDGLKKSLKPMSYMALLLTKQKACETFLEEKGLSDEFADFSMAIPQK